VGRGGFDSATLTKKGLIFSEVKGAGIPERGHDKPGSVDPVGARVLLNAVHSTKYHQLTLLQI
jgi:hypothetical protein